MVKGQNETSWLKHQTLCEIQSTEVFLSEFNPLYRSLIDYMK
jgi:hypothetical protein